MDAPSFRVLKSCHAAPQWALTFVRQCRPALLAWSSASEGVATTRPRYAQSITHRIVGMAGLEPAHHGSTN